MAEANYVTVVGGQLGQEAGLVLGRVPFWLIRFMRLQLRPLVGRGVRRFLGRQINSG